MNTTLFVSNAWMKSNGELPTFTTGSDEWNYVVALGNYFIDQWANEPGVDWNSLYDKAYELGTITSNTIDIDTDEVRKISQEYGDPIRITRTDGNYTDFDLVAADDLYNYPGADVCAQISDQLVFSRAFTVADSEYNGTVTIPAYMFPEKLTGPNSTVPVNNPNWLVAAVASDISRNDILRKDQYPILSAEANQLMERMKSDNEGQIRLVGLPIASGVDW